MCMVTVAELPLNCTDYQNFGVVRSKGGAPLSVDVIYSSMLVTRVRRAVSY